MKQLLNRKIAILITVVVVIAATLFGVHRSLSRLYRDIERMFYDGVYVEDGGYTQPGIYSHLENSMNSALGLATLLQGYPELSGKAEDLLSARRELLAAKSISDKSIADYVMVKTFVDLMIAAQDVNLSEREIEASTKYHMSFCDAHAATVASQYNSKSVETIKKVSFLADFIALIVPVEFPEQYNPNFVPVISLR